MLPHSSYWNVKPFGVHAALNVRRTLENSMNQWTTEFYLFIYLFIYLFTDLPKAGIKARGQTSLTRPNYPIRTCSKNRNREREKKRGSGGRGGGG